jgi:hypothetical protein
MFQPGRGNIRSVIQTFTLLRIQRRVDHFIAYNPRQEWLPGASLTFSHSEHLNITMLQRLHFSTALKGNEDGD